MIKEQTEQAKQSDRTTPELKQEFDQKPKPAPGILLLCGMIIWCILWFAPASLLTVIEDAYGITQAAGGFLMSVICLVAALFGPFSGLLLIRLGIGKTFLMTMSLLAAGSIGTLFADTYSLFVLCRLIIGVGFGLSLSLSASAIMQWFPPRQRPYLNTLYAVLPYIATALNFLLTVQIFGLFGQNFRLTLALPGFFLILLIVLWLIFANGTAAVDTSPPADDCPPFFTLARKLLKNREVRLICIADFCDMWGFQFLSSFLVSYLVRYTGRTEQQASALTSLFPVAGIIGGLLFGMIMSRVGLRKPFTWPMHLLIFAGTLMIVQNNETVQILGIIAAGFGNAAWAPALYTMPMEFSGLTNESVSVLFSLMLTIGYFGSFLSPIVGGLIADAFGLRTALIIFSFFAFTAAVATFLMKETGNRANASIKQS